MSVATVILILAVVLNAVANVLIKVGMNSIGRPDLSQPLKTLGTIFFNPGVMFGIGFFVIALACYSFTLSRFNLSTAYPIMSSLSFMAVLIISAMFLQERMQFVQLVGCAVILLGVWMVASQIVTPSASTPIETASRSLNEAR